METNNRIDYLTYLFEKFTFEEINNNNLFELETFLISVLDDKDNSIFLEILWHNFLLMLKNKNLKSFYLNKLIEEAEIKTLRVFYHSIIMTEQVESTNCNIDSTQHYKKCIKKELDGNGKLHQKEYKITDDGNFVELIKDIPITDSMRLSNPNAATIYEANMKLSENEL